MTRDVHRTLDDGDLALIHALQVAPRVSWAQAGQVLGTSPAALAERWARLRSSGLAWVTAHVDAARPDLIAAFPGSRRTPSSLPAGSG